MHTVPQPPQFEVSPVVSTQDAPHAVLLPQVDLHIPLWQKVPAPHTVPQPPQFFESELRSWHAPEQLLYPVLQLTPHCFAAHNATPLAGVVQTWPHVPQLAASVSTFWQTPLHSV